MRRALIHGVAATFVIFGMQLAIAKVLKDLSDFVPAEGLVFLIVIGYIRIYVHAALEKKWRMAVACWAVCWASIAAAVAIEAWGRKQGAPGLFNCLLQEFLKPALKLLELANGLIQRYPIHFFAAALVLLLFVFFWEFCPPSQRHGPRGT